MPKKIIIRRRRVTRSIGITEAAHALGVKKQSVASYVNGDTSSLRPEFRKRITIIDEN